MYVDKIAPPTATPLIDIGKDCSEELISGWLPGSYLTGSTAKSITTLESLPFPVHSIKNVMNFFRANDLSLSLNECKIAL